MKKTVNIQTNVLIPAALAFHKQDDELQQYLSFKRPTRKRGTTPKEMELPIGKAMKGSIILHKIDSSSGLHYEQQVRIYRKNTKRSTAPILETRYSRVNVSRSRVTVTMSFPICDDPTRLKARLQNFANIIIDESDEIAAMLNQEGDARVQEAWQTIEQSNEENDDAKE
jgi:hypothetical protein